MKTLQIEVFIVSGGGREVTEPLSTDLYQDVWYWTQKITSAAHKMVKSFGDEL